MSSKTSSIKHICPECSSWVCPAGHLDCCFGPIRCFNSCIFLFQIMAVALSFQDCSCDAGPRPTILTELRGCYPVAFADSSTDSPLAEKTPHRSQSSNIIYALYSLLEVFQIIQDKALSNQKTPSITSCALKLLIGNLTESFWPFILAYLEMKHFKSKSSSCSGLCYSWNKGFSNSKPDAHFTSTKQRLSTGVTGNFENYQCQIQCHSSHFWLPLGISEIPAEVRPLVGDSDSKWVQLFFSAALNVSKLQPSETRREHKAYSGSQLAFPHPLLLSIIPRLWPETQSKACLKKKKRAILPWDLKFLNILNVN